MRELLCKTLYKIGLKNAARRIYPKMFYHLFWLDCAESVKKSAETASMSFRALADALNSLSIDSDKGEGKQ